MNPRSPQSPSSPVNAADSPAAGMSPTVRIVTAHPLEMRPAAIRTWRVLLILAAAAMLVMTGGAMTLGAALAAHEDSSYGVVPAVQELGWPDALELDVDLGDLVVRTSPDVRAVTLRMLGRDGEEPVASDTVRARVDVIAPTGSLTRKVHVSGPRISGPAGWAENSVDRIELLVPADLAGDLDLTLHTELGGIEGSGTYRSLVAGTSLGDVDLQQVATTGALTGTSELGEVTLVLTAEAEPGSVRAASSLGDVLVRVPGSRLYRVSTGSGNGGDVMVAAGVPAPDGEDAPALTATTDLGTVRVTR